MTRCRNSITVWVGSAAGEDREFAPSIKVDGTDGTYSVLYLTPDTTLWFAENRLESVRILRDVLTAHLLELEPYQDPLAQSHRVTKKPPAQTDTPHQGAGIGPDGLVG